MKKFLLSIFAVMLAVFSVQAGTEKVTYKVASTTSVTISSGTAPKNSSATFKNTYSTKEQLTKGNSMTLTLNGYQDYKIVGITLSMKSNKSGGAGYYSMKVGNTTLSEITSSAFSNKKWHGSYTTEYTNIVPTMSNADYTIKDNESVVITINATANSLYCQSFTIEYEQVGGVVLPKLTEPIISPESCEFNYGESVVVTIESMEDANVYYTLDGTNPTVNSNLYQGEFEITKTTKVKAIAIKEGYTDSDIVENNYKMNYVVDGGIVDVLNLALTGVSGTTYKEWSGKTATSSAVYAGQSAGGNDAIQLRSNNSNSGIVTTVSGGKVKKISIDWNVNTDAARKLSVYGKNTAYTNPTELYDTSTDGDKLAEIVCGTTEFVIEGDYEYIGLRSASGAMYLNSVEITWVVEEEEPVAETWSSFYAAFPVAIPEGVEAYIVTAANAGYVTLTQIYNAVPANTGVILKGGSIEATNDNYYSGEVTEVTGNLLKGTMTNADISEEAYVLGKVDGVIGLYKALMTDGQWLNNANKAYLPASAVPTSAQGAASFSFRFGEGTTGLENVEVENAVKAIYDLTGRKVEAITAPGIYIVNGVKRVVR